MEARLQSRLEELAQLRQRARRGRTLAICWAIAAVTGGALYLTGIFNDAEAVKAIHWLPLVFGVVLTVVALFRQRRRTDEIQQLLGELEPQEHDVRHLLTAAAAQTPETETGTFGFLQMRVIQEALEHPLQSFWQRRLEQRLMRTRFAQAVSLLALAAVVVAMNRPTTHNKSIFTGSPGEEIAVTPGDTQTERGTTLVIAAKFGGVPPSEVILVTRSESGKESRMLMARRLADPVFGATILEVSEAGIYHIEYRGKKTRDFKITVFEFPALVRADAELRYPAYTGLTNRTIRDTLRVSAVTGTRLKYSLQLNKPVAKARLVNEEQSLILAIESNALVLLPEYVVTNNARFKLELVDSEGRANKFPSDFILQALTNQRPQVKLVFPRGDPRVSRLEELQLSAEAADDFGLLKYGFGFGVAGGEPQIIELGQTAPANTKKQFNYLISLEKLGVEAEQAVAYFAWADDYDPDGRARRTFSDMFFAEVRPFDEIFRPDQSGSSENGNQQGNQGGGAGSEKVRLAELQKQIVIATWNLQREKTGAGGASHP